MGKLKHGQARRGNKSRAYRAWESMLRRCNNPSQDSYPQYGGRGIRVCARWASFENFRADMGECLDGLTLDRRDPEGHYEPDNCRWADQPTQQRNRRNNHLLTFQGETKTLSEWAREKGIKWKTLRARIEDHGWAVERALSEPVRGPL